MATRDPEAKRQQLLDAGLVEFAAHGIAGARMERIARRAGCSAGLAYTHFGSKEALFEAVFDAIVVRATDEVPITPEDLPGYAGRLFDAHEAHPEVMRLATWYRLERARVGASVPAIAAANAAKVAAIRVAQEAGTLTDRHTPEHLLALVLTISAMWAGVGAEPADGGADDGAERRATVVDAVRQLVER